MSSAGKRPGDEPAIEDVVDEIEDVEGTGEVADPDEDLGDEGDGDEGGGDVDRVEDDDDGADEGREDRPAEVRTQSRASQRFQALANERKADRERADRLERELNEIKQAGQRSQTAEQQRAEQERIALMAPDERAEYLVQKTRGELANELGQMRFQMADATDKSGFDSLCARKPAFDGVKGEVEKILRDLRLNGQNNTRENIATFLIGKRAIDRADGAKTRQGKKGAERIARATARPGNGNRSDVQAGSERRGGSEAQARANRLKDLNI